MDYVVKDYIDVDDFNIIRKSVGWKELNRKQLKKAIDNSMFNVSIYDSNRCIGIGRIVGDGVLKGILTDIMVLSEYQGKGVGRLIVTALINRLDTLVKEGECFQLEATPTYSNRNFYIKCGMKYKPEVQDGTYLWIKK